MSAVLELQTASRKTVQTAYDCMDAIFTTSGIRDLTDGIYVDSETDYKTAQRFQRQWMLDMVGCQTSSRLLDIGCGYGTLLEDAHERGAEAVGITLSPKQAGYCQRRGLNVLVRDYRELDPDWQHSFDCIIANGSAEHFVQPADAAAGRQDAIYQEFFKICHELLNPKSSAGRLGTTIIHFGRVRFDSLDSLKPPSCWPRGSDEFHAAMLESALGGYYPEDGQLERCASPHFTLKEAVDGTDDYRRTSEEWLRMIRCSFLNPFRLSRMAVKLLPRLLISPKRVSLVFGLLFSESWQWQFRGPNPPVKLWRHVWQCE